MTPQPPKVLICGGGLGGLTLAQALRKKGIPYEVFERDSSAIARSQGWGIVLHKTLDDIRASFPIDEMPPIETTGSTEEVGLPTRARTYDPVTCEMLDSLPHPDGPHMLRTSREKLHRWLETGLEIQWGKKFERYEEDEHGVTAHFADGTSAYGDVLVGADGVNSNVRRALCGPDAPHPEFVHVAVIWALVTVSGPMLEQMLDLGPSWYLANTGPERLFVGVKNVDATRTGTYLWNLTWPEAGAERDDFWAWHASPAERHAFVQEKVKAIAAPLRAIVEATKPKDMIDPPIRLRDMVPFELPRGRATLLGDAIHPMTPFRGEGGNHAIQDSLNLARAIAGCADTASIPDGLKAYEKEMIERTAEAVLGSREVASMGKKAPPGAHAPWASASSKQ